MTTTPATQAAADSSAPSSPAKTVQDDPTKEVKKSRFTILPIPAAVSSSADTSPGTTQQQPPAYTTQTSATGVQSSTGVQSTPVTGMTPDSTVQASKPVPEK